MSAMKVHELEARIDTLKKMKQIEDELLKQAIPANRGRFPARPIEIEETVGEDGELVRTPIVPTKAPTHYSLKMEKLAQKAVSGELVHRPATAVKPPKQPKEPKETKNTLSYDPETQRVKSRPAVYDPGCPTCGKHE